MNCSTDTYFFPKQTCFANLIFCTCIEHNPWFLLFCFCDKIGAPDELRTLIQTLVYVFSEILIKRCKCFYVEIQQKWIISTFWTNSCILWHLYCDILFLTTLFTRYIWGSSQKAVTFRWLANLSTGNSGCGLWRYLWPNAASSTSWVKL